MLRLIVNLTSHQMLLTFVIFFLKLFCVGLKKNDFESLFQTITIQQKRHITMYTHVLQLQNTIYIQQLQIGFQKHLRIRVEKEIGLRRLYTKINFTWSFVYQSTMCLRSQDHFLREASQLVQQTARIAHDLATQESSPSISTKLTGDDLYTTYSLNPYLPKFEVGLSAFYLNVVYGIFMDKI